MSAAKASDDGGDPIGYDVATALWQGKRPYQEDTLLADFHGGMDRGFAVLADGMGGHAAGDLASRLVVIDAVSHLKFLMHDGAALERNLQAELTSAIETANDVLKDRGADDRRLQGMGATFLATVMFEDRLYWASVGDSPLYLWRKGKLRQLNEDHSMAPIIDQMAKTGELTEEEAANHPDRNALTSVLMGRNVKSMDVPATATILDRGDVLIQASDGLQYLDEKRIVSVLDGMEDGASSRAIADALMQALYDLDDPAQDNTAIMVLQLCKGIGDGGRGAASHVAAKAEGERAMVAAAGDVAKGEDTPPANVSRAVAEPDGAPGPEDVGATTVAPVAPPPEGRRRRILVPAALLGGAAVALGLIFGLPSEQDETAALPGLAEVESDDAKGVSEEPDVGAVAQGDTPPDAGNSVDGDVPTEDPAPDAEPEEALVTPDAGGTDTTPDAVETDTTPEAGETDTTPDAGETDTTPEAGETDTTPEAGETDTTPEAGETDTTPETGEADEVPEAGIAPDTAETPVETAEDATAGSEPQPVPQPAPGAPDASAEGTGAEDMPQEIIGDAQAPVEPETPGTTGAETQGDAASSGSLGAAPRDASGGDGSNGALLPPPAPSPVPAAPVPGGEGAAPAPAIGAAPLREGLSAPSDAGDAAPVSPLPRPQPQPQPQPPIVPQPDAETRLPAPPIFGHGIAEDDRAGQTAPAGPSAIAPGVPMLPPFAGSIHRICQHQQCFAFIRQPDGSVAILQRNR